MSDTGKIKAEPLAALAAGIRDCMKQRQANDTAWIDATLVMCDKLAEARRAFQTTAAFAKWCGDESIELPKGELAVAVLMGNDLERAREAMLLSSNRSSLKRIEIRMRGPYKPKTTSPGQPRARPLQPAKVDRNDEIVERWHAGQQREEIARLMGIGEHAVQLAIAREAGKEEERERLGVKPVDPASFSETQQVRYQRAIKELRRELRAEIEAEVRGEVQKYWDTVHLPHFRERLRRADQILAAQRGIFSKSDYQKILRVLHPDTNASEGARTEAFRLFHAKEEMLVKAEVPAATKTLPKNMAEMMEMRRHRSEELSRRAKEAAQRRK